MRKIIFLLVGVMIFAGVGCSRIEPNPYELTKEARKQMRPDQQEAYINQIKALEALVAVLNDEGTTYDQAMSAMQSFYSDLPEDWSWEKDTKPMDRSWRFFMEMMDAFMGCQNFSNYADCKDDIDALGKEMSDLFTQANDRRRALIIGEERFYEYYEAGKKQNEVAK